MDNVIMFTIPGQPVAKARPRFRSSGGKVHTYTPDKTVSYENLVKLFAAEVMAGRPEEWPLDGQYILEVTAYFRIPQSKPKKFKDMARDGKIRPIVRPDWDNVGKIVSDALNGILWADDSRIVQATVYKYYSDSPRVIVQAIRLPEGE